MHFFKPLTGLGTLCVILLFSQTHLTSCQKQIIYDTIFIKDSVCDCNVSSLKKGLVAYYNFNGGNLNDSSGYNNHIIFNNAVKVTDQAGVANNAYQFNGTSSYMQVKNSTSLNPDSITIVARVKVDGFYSGPCSVSQIVGKGFKDQDVNGIYGMRICEVSEYICSKPIDVNKQTATGYNGNGAITAGYARDTTAFVQTGKWKTYVFTYDREHAAMYTDGILTGAMERKTAFNSGIRDLFIGRMEDPQYPYWFNGVIDEIRIYNRPLCASEVKLLQTVIK